MSVSGVTALHAAALDGKLDTVRYLLDNGADPNKKDEPGEVPLHCAAKYGTPLHILYPINGFAVVYKRSQIYIIME